MGLINAFPQGGGISPSSALDLIVYGKKLSATIDENTITFTDDMIAKQDTVIDGPYVQGFHVTVVSDVVSGNTVTIDLANDYADGTTAYIYLR